MITQNITLIIKKYGNTYSLKASTGECLFLTKSRMNMNRQIKKLIPSLEVIKGDRIIQYCIIWYL